MTLFLLRDPSNWGNYRTDFQGFLETNNLLNSDGLYNTSNLCSNCEQFNSELSLPPGPDGKRSWPKRESYFDWRSVELCPLCVFIRDAGLYATEYKYRHPHGQTLTFGHRKGTVGFYHVSTREVESPLIASIILPGDEGRGVQGRLFQRSKTDFDILRGWITQCSELHDCDKTIPPLGLSTFCLIDCTESKIVPAYSSSIINKAQYVALSYVWGERSQDPSCLTSPLKASRPLRDIPQVIADAMEVVKKMGYVYLWVDRYCIPQGNTRRAVEIMDDHLSKMGHIYANAVFTIIAAAGTDPSHGLPGVSCLRDRQPAIKIGDYTLVGVVNPAFAISESKWNHRGWTFQEGLLSRRRLVFTQTQVYFQCQLMQCVESFSAPVPFDGRILTTAIFPQCYHNNQIVDDETNDNETEDDDVYCQPWINKLAQKFFSCIDKYAGRDLAHDADAYQAFRGIRTLFRSMEPPLHLFLGLPIISPVAEGRQESAQRPVQSDQQLQDKDASANKELAAALCWSFEMSDTMIWSGIEVQEPIRRSCFPSWTWLGWKRSQPSGYYKVIRSYKQSVSIADLENGVEDVMRYHLHSVLAEFESGVKLAWDSHWIEICDMCDTSGFKSLEIEGWLFESEDGSTNLVLASCYTPDKEPSENYPETLFALRLKRLLEQNTYERADYIEYYSEEAYERLSDERARFGSFSLRQATICLR